MSIKRIEPTHLAAAMSTPESGVATPTRQVAGSLTSQLLALEVGECASKVTVVDPALTLAEYMEQGSALREQLRNAVTSSVAYARKRSEYAFTIEVGSMITTGNALYLVAIVTRIS